MGEGELTPLDVVEQWHLRAWQEHDLSAVDELVAEPFVRHNRDGTSKRTRADVRSDLRHYHEALGKPVVEVRERVASGDKVWSRTTMRGANLVSGEPHTLHLIQIHRVEAGRIVEVWTLHAGDVEWDS